LTSGTCNTKALDRCRQRQQKQRPNNYTRIHMIFTCKAVPKA
jgi:hypothetical protein